MIHNDNRKNGFGIYPKEPPQEIQYKESKLEELKDYLKCYAFQIEEGSDERIRIENEIEELEHDIDNYYNGHEFYKED